MILACPRIKMNDNVAAVIIPLQHIPTKPPHLAATHSDGTDIIGMASTGSLLSEPCKQVEHV